MGPEAGASTMEHPRSEDGLIRQVALGVPAGDIAVVTPYQAQVSLVSSMLHEDFPEMTIGSVDGLQGQRERWIPHQRRSRLG